MNREYSNFNQALRNAGLSKTEGSDDSVYAVTQGGQNEQFPFNTTAKWRTLGPDKCIWEWFAWLFDQRNNRMR